MRLGYGFRENLGPPVNMNQADFFTAGLMFDIPIWRAPRSSPGSVRSRNARARPRKPIKIPGISLAAAIKDRHAKLQRLAQQITLYNQGIMPQARQAVEASLASYQVGLRICTAVSEPDRRLITPS